VNPGLTAVEITGSDYSDDLGFHYSTYDFDGALNGSGFDNVAGTIKGGDGLDVITGSNLSSHFSEELYGEGDKDTISGMGGDDYIDGGACIDTITGGPGDDTIQGGDDDDWISGGSGSDTIVGGGGDDILIGDGGDDVLNGGPGNDTLCGGPQDTSDVLNDGETGPGSADILWGASYSDSDYCGSSTSLYDGYASTSTCRTSTTKPDACP
jgi:Ca2+-binding RTX toxin-like protein